MGRGRVQLKLIENKINRQVTFSKRRKGLLKKAQELAVLCDVEVALIIFSGRGKLFEFGSTEISKTIERYQIYQYASQDIETEDHEKQNWYMELCKCKATYESLQRCNRNLLGEDLEQLSMKELQQLERRLESALSRTRSRRTQKLLEQMEELKTKEYHLKDVNKQLKHQLEAKGGGSSIAMQGSWELPHVMTEGSASLQLPSQRTKMELIPPTKRGSVAPETSTARAIVRENNYMPGLGSLNGIRP